MITAESIRQALDADSRSGALISDDGIYRYLLWRSFWPPPGTAPLGFVCLNPSKAGAVEDDPSIRRMLGYAYREGASGIIVGNVTPIRATDPGELPARFARGYDHDPAPNRLALEELASRCPVVVVAWGATFGRANWRQIRVAEAMKRIAEADALAVCLGTTKEGHPRHPLYVRGDQPLIPWEAAR